MSGRAKLVLQNLDPEDSGMYMCVAENDGGVVEGTAQITVRGIYNQDCGSFILFCFVLFY